MPPADDGGGAHRIACHLDALLAERGMTLTELSERVGVSVVNLSVLKNNRARAIRFSTLTAVCDVLGCQPGDVLSLSPAERPGDAVSAGRAPRGSAGG
jgi:putative transcriptional regulator